MDRTSARVAAMKLLYEWEMGGDGGEDTRFGLLELQPEEPETDYMDAVVEGVKANVAKLDELIAQYAIGWKLERLRKVDLTILRMGAYELLYTDLFTSVAINEAVTLARTYSTPEAGTFVNGVLGKIARENEA